MLLYFLITVVWLLLFVIFSIATIWGARRQLQNNRVDPDISLLKFGMRSYRLVLGRIWRIFRRRTTQTLSSRSESILDQIGKLRTAIEKLDRCWYDGSYERNSKEFGIQKAFHLLQRTESSRNARQEEFLRLIGLDPDEYLLLHDDWGSAIGHIASLDNMEKLTQLERIPRRHMVLITAPNRVVNIAYLMYWKKYVTIMLIPDPLFNMLSAYTQPAALKKTALLKLNDGREEFLHNLYGEVQSIWERRGNKALLELSEIDREKGREGLTKLGLPPGAWYVCLHVRSSGYWSDADCPRNTDISTYAAAIYEITSRGGWVIRMGDSSMPPLPVSPQVIDYAHSSYKADWMDVVLFASCKFFLGCTSGPYQVPPTFGVPCAIVNWISNMLPFNFGKFDRFIPKMMWREDENRFLSFSEMLDFDVRHSTNSRIFGSTIEIARSR